ncbi:MAG: hypothetical protein M0Z54_11495 [Thermaerobacter sp.]|nr:hypothetical protein [Thermaerobacter sp.]
MSQHTVDGLVIQVDAVFNRGESGPHRILDTLGVLGVRNQSRSWRLASAAMTDSSSGEKRL